MRGVRSRRHVFPGQHSGETDLNARPNLQCRLHRRRGDGEIIESDRRREDLQLTRHRSIASRIAGILIENCAKLKKDHLVPFATEITQRNSRVFGRVGTEAQCSAGGTLSLFARFFGPVYFRSAVSWNEL